MLENEFGSITSNSVIGIFSMPMCPAGVVKFILRSNCDFYAD